MKKAAIAAFFTDAGVSAERSVFQDRPQGVAMAAEPFVLRLRT
ncbi:MAG TPA: hypothetical protein VFM34_01265 [Moraxellaceae bacterium]|nr:hypothetical protein [Moraxellaceae bacterium]